MMVRAAAVGIMGLGFEGIADCQPRFLSMLLNSSPRGVVENSKYMTMESAWRVILGDGDLKSMSIIPSNIPITNPTMGQPSLDLNSVSLQEELNAVYREFSRQLGRGIIAASINTFERHSTCDALNLIDSYLESMYTKLDSFMFFSPYGGLEGGSRSRYGIYISTVQRPQEDQTIKLEEIMPLMLELNQ
ncbi:MAG: hypothetical protein ACP5NC_00265 [Nitrososphaeria archaeon]